MSIRTFLDKSKKLTTARLINKINKKEVIMKPKIPDELSEALTKIIRPH